MVRKYFLLVTFIFLFGSTFKNIAQIKPNRFGLGASVGFEKKIQLNYTLSNRIQISLDIGNILIGGDFQIDNLGLSLKYFFHKNDLLPFTGIAASLIYTEGAIFHFYIPVGLQEFATENLAVFFSFNPGILFVNDYLILFGVQLGATFYL